MSSFGGRSGQLLSSLLFRARPSQQALAGTRPLPDDVAELLGAGSGVAPLGGKNSILSRVLGLPAGAATVNEAVRGASPGVGLRAHLGAARRGGRGLNALISALPFLERASATLTESQSRRAARVLAPHVARIIAHGDSRERTAAGSSFLNVLTSFDSASSSREPRGNATSRANARLTLARSTLAASSGGRDALSWLPAQVALAVKLQSPETAEAAIAEARLGGGGGGPLAASMTIEAARRARGRVISQFIRPRRVHSEAPNVSVRTRALR